MNQTTLKRETIAYQGSGGVSAESRCLGFRPAFQDAETGCVYASRFADGRLAPFHLIDGLPEEVVAARNAAGKVIRVKDSVISGFTLNDCFYDRDEAAQIVNGRPAYAQAA